MTRLFFFSFLLSCACQNAGSDSSAASGGAGNPTDPTGGTEGVGGRATGGGATDAPSGPLPHPPPNFEDCIHTGVNADCSDGWCTAPSCFVMGSSPDDPFYPANGSQKQVAVTHSCHRDAANEMTRKQWRDIVATTLNLLLILPVSKTIAPSRRSLGGKPLAANLLSEQKGLNPCYKPLNCSGEMGRGRICEGQNPLDVIYSCEGYRLPTRARTEYPARAGTITHLYSGELTVYENPFRVSSRSASREDRLVLLQFWRQDSPCSSLSRTTSACSTNWGMSRSGSMTSITLFLHLRKKIRRLASQADALGRK